MLERDDALDRETRLLIIAGYYDRALELLGDRRFHILESGGRMSVHDSCVDAHLLRQQQHMHAGRFTEARQNYEAALAFLENLSMGGFARDDRKPQIYHYLWAPPSRRSAPFHSSARVRPEIVRQCVVVFFAPGLHILCQPADDVTA